jgi:hypothetical protein
MIASRLCQPRMLSGLTETPCNLMPDRENRAEQDATQDVIARVD